MHSARSRKQHTVPWCATVLRVKQLPDACEPLLTTCLATEAKPRLHHLVSTDAGSTQQREEHPPSYDIAVAHIAAQRRHRACAAATVLQLLAARLPMLCTKQQANCQASAHCCIRMPRRHQTHLLSVLHTSPIRRPHVAQPLNTQRPCWHDAHKCAQQRRWCCSPMLPLLLLLSSRATAIAAAAYFAMGWLAM
jgi:hypothetical protein